MNRYLPIKANKGIPFPHRPYVSVLLVCFEVLLLCYIFVIFWQNIQQTDDTKK